MRKICGERGFRLLAFFASTAQFFVSAYSDDLSTSNNGTKAEHSRGSSKGSKIVVLGLALVAGALISFFIFKFWQRKKREEQYARLLKLFEEDDDLELEFGLQD